MMKEKYETLPLTTLKELAKARGLKGISTMKKAQVIELMLQEDEKEQEKEKQEKRETVKEMSANTGDKEIHDIDRLDSGIVARGILEVMPDGFGFIRSDNYLPGDNDIYISPSQIRRFNLKTGDILEGHTRIKTQQEKFSALLYLTKVNDTDPMELLTRSSGFVTLWRCFCRLLSYLWVGSIMVPSAGLHLVHCHFNHRNLQRLRLFYFWLLTSHAM